MRSLLLICSVALVGLAACDTTPRPDYRIVVTPGPDGQLQAIAPTCASWVDEPPNPLSNEPWPQFRCASTRNLAAMVERPEDLIRGRDWGDANGEQVSASMRRYIQDKTYPMIDPSKDAEEGPVASSSSAASRTPSSTGSGGSAPAPAAP